MARQHPLFRCGTKGEAVNAMTRIDESSGSLFFRSLTSSLTILVNCPLLCTHRDILASISNEDEDKDKNNDKDEIKDKDQS